MDFSLSPGSRRPTCWRAYFYAWARVLRIVDGPDAVHRRSIARQELRRERPFTG